MSVLESPHRPHLDLKLASESFLEIVLVVLLGVVPRGGTLDLSCDRSSESVDCVLGNSSLGFILRKDRGHVLRLGLGAVVVHGEEFGDEVGIANLGRIVDDLHSLAVTRLARADGLVRRLVRSAARVANTGRDDARNLLKRRLRAPESACDEPWLPEARSPRTDADYTPRAKTATS